MSGRLWTSITRRIRDDGNIAEHFKTSNHFGCCRRSMQPFWMPQSQTQSAADALLLSIDLAVEAERLGMDGAYFRVHHFARQLASPFPACGSWCEDAKDRNWHGSDRNAV
jgi:hypothetical protein